METGVITIPDKNKCQVITSKTLNHIATALLGSGCYIGPHSIRAGFTQA